MSTLLPDGISVQWFGHAFFVIAGPNGQKFAIDPFFASNPAFPVSATEEISRPGAFDYLLVTHPHFDHFEGVLPLLKNDPQLVAVAQYEVAQWINNHGIPEPQAIGMNTGGTVTLKEVRVTMTASTHTSSYGLGSESVALGTPAGFVLRLANGFTIYNAGDTAVTADMGIIRDLYHPDLVILPIGDFYTMGPEQAAYALKLLQPRFALGGHYGTFGGNPPGRPKDWRIELQKYPEVTTVILELEPGQKVV